MSSFKIFSELHHGNELLVLPNAWNAKSALLLEQSGFKAAGTSSAAVAESLGYGDGEQMPFQDYLFVVKRIVSTIKLPFSVDLEMGYGKTSEEIYANVARLAQLGVVGINLEDSRIDNSVRTLQELDVFANKLENLKNRIVRQHIEMFVNVRCDAYLLALEDKREETSRRARSYESSGADGLFLPCIARPEDIKEAVGSTRLPVNVMCFPGLPDFDSLSALGVKRLSLGGFLFDSVYKSIRNTSDTILERRTTTPLIELAMA
jgi:2-methylisocitrate lyase-like PEP mutase family enzyme